jgi:hypothetical protein
MLVSRHGVTDSRSHAHRSWGEYPTFHRVPVAGRLTWGGESPEAGFQVACGDLAVCAYGCREVAL